MKNPREIVLTPEGLQKLQDELDELKLVKRKEISEQLKVARSFGDLSENSEYDEAKNAQAINEAKILELETTIKNARVMEASEMTNEKVHMGSKVRVYNSLMEEEETYTIVGSAEVEPLELKISDESPIGKALSGARVGDVVEVSTPAGKVLATSSRSPPPPARSLRWKCLRSISDLAETGEAERLQESIFVVLLSETLRATNERSKTGLPRPVSCVRDG